MRRLGAALLLMVIVARSAAAQDAAAALAKGLAAYRAYHLDSALTFFDAAARANPGDADALTWFAETARRLGRFDEAEAAARRAGTLAPCHSFAHTVLGDVLNPQYSWYSGADQDSSWSHLAAAVRCDPDDGNAWLGLWIHALRRGDTTIERTALRRLVASGFLPRSPLALARALLSALPPHAIVLANGDWDTYPTVAVQLVEGMRTDVAVVNLPMLNLAWYALRQARLWGVPLPFDSLGLEAFEPFRDAAGADVTLADSIVRAWRHAAVAGSLGRPLAYAATVGEAILRRGAGATRWHGLYIEVTAGASDPDTAHVWRILERIDPKAFAGPTTSPRDRSAVRQNAPPIANNLLWIAAQLSAMRDSAGDTAGARAALMWARRYAAGAELRDSTTTQFLREIAGRLGN